MLCYVLDEDCMKKIEKRYGKTTEFEERVDTLKAILKERSKMFLEKNKVRRKLLLKKECSSNAAVEHPSPRPSKRK